MEQSPRLSLSYVMPAQTQKHVTVNESLRRLDALTQLTVQSRTTTAEPAAPSDGDAYILPAGASGAAWDNFASSAVAAFQDSAWAQITPAEGWRAWVSDNDELVVHDGAGWQPVSASAESAAKFGVNTTADATNKLAVKSNAVLFDALDTGESGTGDSQVKVNKEAAGDTASVLFQTGFSGRAEFGLTGDDDFHIKVSPDGASWNEAIVIDKTSAEVTVNAAGGNAFRVNSDSDSYNMVMAFQDNSPGQQRIGAFNFLDDTNGAVGQFAYFFDQATPANQYMRFLVNGATVAQFNGDGGMTVGSPTGGQKGAGTINAQAVYDDNTLLSCYVFDQALDGAIDTRKWDSKVPDRRIKNTDAEGKVVRDETIKRRHEPLRKFAARAGTAHDPLTLEGYARHWKEKRHLTSLPNEATFDGEKGMPAGEWIQRLVETVEIQAVLIDQLSSRINALSPQGRK